MDEDADSGAELQVWPARDRLACDEILRRGEELHRDGIFPSVAYLQVVALDEGQRPPDALVVGLAWLSEVLAAQEKAAGRRRVGIVPPGCTGEPAHFQAGGRRSEAASGEAGLLAELDM